MHTESYWPDESKIVADWLTSLGVEFTATPCWGLDGAQWLEFTCEVDLLPPQGLAGQTIAAIAAAVERRDKRRHAKRAKRQELSAAQTNVPMDTIRPFHTPGCCGHVDMVIPHGEGQVVCYTGPRSEGGQ